jgi:transposase
MRKSFDGLCVIVTTHLEQDPPSWAVFLFLNRRRDRIKLLVWDRNGFWIERFKNLPTVQVENNRDSEL